MSLLTLLQTRTAELFIGLAVEADSALSLALEKRLSLGRADEADSASAVSLQKVLALGRADEVDSAFALSFGGGVIELAMGRADEIDTALSPGGPRNLFWAVPALADFDSTAAWRVFDSFGPARGF